MCALQIPPFLVVRKGTSLEKRFNWIEELKAELWTELITFPKILITLLYQGLYFIALHCNPWWIYKNTCTICGVMKDFLMKTASARNIYVGYSFSREKWVHFVKEGIGLSLFKNHSRWTAVGVDTLHIEVARHFSGPGLQSSVFPTFSDSFLYWKPDDNYHFWKSLDIFFFL